MRELTAPLKNPDPEVRAARARALAFIEQLDQHVIAALVAASEDDDALVRRDATLSLGALGRVGEAETVAKALTARLKDQDTLTQRIATEGLGELGRADPAAIASLRAILLDDDAGRTRVIAAQALVQLGQQDDTLITFLIASLKADDPFVRSYAAAACGRLQPSDETVIAALEGTLNDGFIPLRFAASESLRRLGRGDADLIRALTDALNSPMDKVRTVAAGYLLHWVGNADHRAAVIRALREEEDPALRAQAAGILSQLGEPDRAAMAALGEAANDKNATVREAATNALMKIAPETAARAAVKPPPP
jgi:HEAT repeat protein